MSVTTEDVMPFTTIDEKIAPTGDDFVFICDSEDDGKLKAVRIDALPGGQQGPQGEAGVAGEPGLTGACGEDGAQGPKGDKGDAGSPDSDLPLPSISENRVLPIGGGVRLIGTITEVTVNDVNNSYFIMNHANASVIVTANEGFSFLNTDNTEGGTSMVMQTGTKVVLWRLENQAVLLIVT